jgi:hypothetical protein
LDDKEDAIKLHERIFKKLRSPSESAYVAFTTWFQVGLRLAKLHAENGDQREHDEVLRRITRKAGGGDDEENNLRERLSRITYAQLSTTRALRSR